MSEYTMHTLIGPGGAPLCGATEPGPVPWGQVTKIITCLDCMKVGPEGLPYEATMRAHLEKVRGDLARKLRGMSEPDRANFKETIFSAAAGSLADPDSSPALYGEKELLAALYSLAAVRAAFYQMKRSGVPPTWAVLENGTHELEMIVVAFAEGTPL